MKKRLMCMLLGLTVLTGVIAGCGNTVEEGNVGTTDSTEVSVEEQSSKQTFRVMRKVLKNHFIC